ncbi:NUDIX hydrolase [Lactococcus taiwanensis]|uniref:NUDIX hydrolase n=1 Tax=Lactococcus taiwanensis TaxID=1151742 RepID=A0AA45KGE4_9LACT|nr:NUDIX hydrolase [Lactococcus taiwanensis]KZK36825.1 Mutator mutT protein (78-dihydro-8-oxoguanine-triphosphatase) [Lactococcus cremoris]QRZ10758.1 NUDIX hydrolase [Lactococcus taiwanensis]QSE76865.1 NUDIX hydrolase [Lactococcus taiwanensis]
MKEIPVFGEKVEGKSYQARYGVYAIVTKSGSDICLVQAPNGAFLLPGGEIEPGENHELALKRELLEELGATARIGAYLGQADEYFYSSHRNKYFYNPAYLYETQELRIEGAPLEDFNTIFWCSPQEALQKLKRGSHRWGVQEWLNKQQNTI